MTAEASIDLRPAPLRQALAQVDDPVTGILLAGGRSRRMGRDKAWERLAGRPLVLWVLDVLKEVSQEQLVVARDAQQARRLEELGVPVVVDRFEARGPLTGIHAGLAESKTDLCLVVACDLPLVRPALLELLAAAVGPMHAALPYVGEGPPPARLGAMTARDAGLQPLLAAYRRSCLPALEKLLRAGPMPTTALISLLKAKMLPPEIWREADPDGRSFYNVNTPEDLAEAVRMLSRGD
jgi:molybdopterin-guanine dinucleotide biosynthesis protein A